MGQSLTKELCRYCDFKISQYIHEKKTKKSKSEVSLLRTAKSHNTYTN